MNNGNSQIVGRAAAGRSHETLITRLRLAGGRSPAVPGLPHQPAAVPPRHLTARPPGCGKEPR